MRGLRQLSQEFQKSQLDTGFNAPRPSTAVYALLTGTAFLCRSLHSWNFTDWSTQFLEAR